MNLIVDIGNTRVKLAVFDGGRPIDERQVERLLPAMIDELKVHYPALRRAIVSSTRGDTEEVAELLRQRLSEVVSFTPQTPVPIGNAYRTPETLGRDRLAAAVGAAELFRGRNVLIFDFGTALTIDLVTADGVYRGGSISPGMRTRFRALHDYTACLPLCDATDDVLPWGDATRSAVEQGVMNGMTYEIEGHIARMREKFADLCVIFTGGDAKFFEKRIKNTIFANCNLVVCGLNRILAYHASEENHL